MFLVISYLNLHFKKTSSKKRQQLFIINEALKCSLKFSFTCQSKVILRYFLATENNIGETKDRIKAGDWNKNLDILLVLDVVHTENA